MRDHRKLVLQCRLVAQPSIQLSMSEKFIDIDSSYFNLGVEGKDSNRPYASDAHKVDSYNQLVLNEENDTDKDVGNNREKRRKGNKQHNRALSLERRDVDEASIEEFQIVAEDKEDLNTNYQSIETQKQSPRRKKQTRLQPISSTDSIRVYDDSKQKKQTIQESQKKLRNTKRQDSSKSRANEIAKMPIGPDDLIAGKEQDFVRAHIAPRKYLRTLLKRNRSGVQWFYPRYQMYFLEEMRLIMQSKRQALKWGSLYFMGAGKGTINQQAPQYAGTVRSNFSGSIWNFYDKRQGEQELLATFIYENQLKCSENPRALQIYIISPFYSLRDLGDYKGKDLQQLANEGDNLAQKRIYKLINKKPVWNPDLQVFQMNFRGKAKQSSVKNMILVNALRESEEILVLGKCAENTYMMEFEFPLSPRVAMAIVTSSFDFKWASQ